MKTYKTVKGLQKVLDQCRVEGKRIAFVPTMGALHEGHISLVELASQRADIVVVSIFVNPSQFNSSEDLNKYPRMVEKDSKFLRRANCNFLFIPEVDEVYPKNLNTTVTVDLNGRDRVMEGHFRPGHFDGMLQVVHRLLDIVKPDYLYMGQKDFQQFTLVHQMINELKPKIELVIGPTMRENDGLAMSSRNLRLSGEMRKIAPKINKALLFAKEHYMSLDLNELEKICIDKLTKVGLKPEYFEIVDGFTLKKVQKHVNSDYLVACVAAWAGNVRLIDNIILKGHPN
ncbi:MAG: pantoate--beta-alanine ligase [Saprospiraceae bacterium]|nr:pantoate--beta-alanine ligase [Candidatus Vicinibacter affinis]